jgi:tetratricopeptide (TPR) repeat protein
LEDSQIALKQAPDDPYCLSAVGSVLQAVNETTAALENYSRILNSTTATAELVSFVHSQIGWASYIDGDLAKSREEYEAALRIDPESKNVHYGLALVLAGLGDLAGANREIGYLVQDEADRSETYVCRGEIRRQSGDLAGALDDFGEALKRNPRRPEAYGYRALVHLAQGKAAEAASDLEKCYSMDAHQKPYFERLASQIKTRSAETSR